MWPLKSKSFDLLNIFQGLPCCDTCPYFILVCFAHMFIGVRLSRAVCTLVEVRG